MTNSEFRMSFDHLRLLFRSILFCATLLYSILYLQYCSARYVTPQLEVGFSFGLDSFAKFEWLAGFDWGERRIVSS
jgi:hypothetical protein